jgi:hypothetical protein
MIVSYLTESTSGAALAVRVVASNTAQIVGYVSYALLTITAVWPLTSLSCNHFQTSWTQR